jgi:hypothetical protein
VLRGYMFSVLRGYVFSVLRGYMFSVLRGYVFSVLRGYMFSVLRGYMFSVLRGYIDRKTDSMGSNGGILHRWSSSYGGMAGRPLYSGYERVSLSHMDYIYVLWL